MRFGVTNNLTNTKEAYKQIKIRWQWNSYGNSSRILIRVLVGTFRVKYITQMTYEFFKNFDPNSG